MKPMSLALGNETPEAVYKRETFFVGLGYCTVLQIGFETIHSFMEQGFSYPSLGRAIGFVAATAVSYKNTMQIMEQYGPARSNE